MTKGKPLIFICPECGNQMNILNKSNSKLELDLFNRILTFSCGTKKSEYGCRKRFKISMPYLNKIDFLHYDNILEEI